MVDCWHKRRNVMLADEMGLGKTAQCVATLSHIHALGPAGPFLIVAPLSTINHWARELRAWSSLRVVVLHGSAADRALLLKRLWHAAPGPRGTPACPPGTAAPMPRTEQLKNAWVGLRVC